MISYLWLFLLGNTGLETLKPIQTRLILEEQTMFIFTDDDPDLNTVKQLTYHFCEPKAQKNSLYACCFQLIF